MAAKKGGAFSALASPARPPDAAAAAKRARRAAAKEASRGTASAQSSSVGPRLSERLDLLVLLLEHNAAIAPGGKLPPLESSLPAPPSGGGFRGAAQRGLPPPKPSPPASFEGKNATNFGIGLHGAGGSGAAATAEARSQQQLSAPPQNNAALSAFCAAMYVASNAYFEGSSSSAASRLVGGAAAAGLWRPALVSLRCLLACPAPALLPPQRAALLAGFVQLASDLIPASVVAATPGGRAALVYHTPTLLAYCLSLGSPWVGHSHLVPSSPCLPTEVVLLDSDRVPLRRAVKAASSPSRIQDFSNLRVKAPGSYTEDAECLRMTRLVARGCAGERETTVACVPPRKLPARLGAALPPPRTTPLSASDIAAAFASTPLAAHLKIVPPLDLKSGRINHRLVLDEAGRVATFIEFDKGGTCNLWVPSVRVPI